MCQCFSGTSGRYCEQYNGVLRPSCVNGCPCPQPQQCPVPQPPQQTQASEINYLKTQNQCYTSEIISLKTTITVYHITYDIQWEMQIRQKFTVIWNKWHPGTTLTSDDDEWKLCLTVALNIKIMIYYKSVIFEEQQNISIKLKYDQCASNVVLLVNIVER